MSSNRINFIDKDDAWSVLLTLFKQITDARCTNADEHFDKVGSADRKERHIGFTGNRPCKQCFSRSRRANQQNAFRNTSAKLLELLRFLKKVNNLLQFFLRFLDSRNIFKCDLLLMCGQQPGPALAERQGLITATLHLA